MKLILSSTIASVVSILFVTIITIWGESSPPLKDFLKGLTGHHWVTKSVGVILIYIAVMAFIYFVFPKINSQIVAKKIMNLVLVTILGTLAILAFFVWHFIQ